MFTRKHYKAVAEIIRRNQTRLRTADVVNCNNGLPCLHPDVVAGLADYFAQDDPRFDREKFLAACEIE